MQLIKIIGLILLFFLFIIGGSYLYEEGFTWIGLILEGCGFVTVIYGFINYIKNILK